MVMQSFLNEVIAFLDGQGLPYWVEFEIGGLTLDLAIAKDSKFFGINLIGYPGAFQAGLSTNDHKVLVRAGIPTFCLPYSYWKFEQSDTAMKFLQTMRIGSPYCYW